MKPSCAHCRTRTAESTRAGLREFRKNRDASRHHAENTGPFSQVTTEPENSRTARHTDRNRIHRDANQHRQHPQNIKNVKANLSISLIPNDHASQVPPPPEKRDKVGAMPHFRRLSMLAPGSAKESAQAPRRATMMTGFNPIVAFRWRYGSFPPAKAHPASAPGLMRRAILAEPQALAPAQDAR